MNARMRLYGEATLVFTAVVAVTTTPWIANDLLGDTPAGWLIVGFLSLMAGGSLTLGAVALGQILHDARQAARR